MDKFIVRAVGIIDKEIELAEVRLFVSSLCSPSPGTSLSCTTNNGEPDGRVVCRDEMPRDGPEAEEIQEGAVEQVLASKQMHVPLASPLSSSEDMAPGGKRKRSDLIRNHKNPRGGSKQLVAQCPSLIEVGQGLVQVKGMTLEQIVDKLGCILDLKLQPLIEYLNLIEAKIQQHEFVHDRRNHLSNPRNGCSVNTQESHVTRDEQKASLRRNDEGLY
ncbi:hypothetical protein NDU88_003852 [Pleurodeles waltl]|uniref:Uncharacterized protein n=1 Tax=Pleurodeles waltl TaxID=8319 RepID=A0AAV7PJD2_PLEWA|nr:hypothetical protein NDU88_003852 [Pleurodeles waltl]